MPPEQYLRKFSLDEFSRHPVGAATASLRQEFARVSGPVLYRHTAPYFLHTVHGRDDYALSSYYAVSGGRSEKSGIVHIEVAAGNGGYDDFLKRFLAYDHNARVSADFWIMPGDPDTVYLMGGRKFACQPAAPQTAAEADAFLAEMAQYIRRMDSHAIVNFLQDGIDVLSASPRASDREISPQLIYDAKNRFDPGPVVKGAVTRHVNTRPDWPACYKPTL